MPTKENKCQCALCRVEHDLLHSLNTQTARIHFQALAHSYPILNQFDSPADLIAQLREHDDVEGVKRLDRNAILHVLVNSLADRIAEETGQQLLLLAFKPAIHRSYVEVRQLFPDLGADDIAQQAWLVFLEALRLPVVKNQNAYLPAALPSFREQAGTKRALSYALSVAPTGVINPNRTAKMNPAGGSSERPPDPER